MDKRGWIDLLFGAGRSDIPLPPEPPEDVIRYLADDECTTEQGVTTMSKTTATVATLAAAVLDEATKRGVAKADTLKFLGDNGVAVKESHTVTITATGDTFAEVRDRAVSDVTTYGPGYPESGFPVTSVKGVSYAHTVEVTLA